MTKFGSMKCGILGGFSACIGLSVSFVATSIMHLVLTIGIVSGMLINVRQWKGQSRMANPETVVTWGKQDA